MNASKEKKELRKVLHSKRAQISEAEVHECSEKILNTLSKYLNWTGIESLHTYLAIKKYREIDTHNLIKLIKRNRPSTKIEVAPQQKHIEVPSGKQYDLIILPMLGFDRRGYRLGYGGGYYDRFLANNDCNLVIGLAYSFQEVQKIPNEPFDKKMDIIITEKEIIHL